MTLNVPRIDLCFDRYLENNLKSTTRQKRGSSSAVRFKPDTVFPKNWNMLLSNSENKTTLFKFLAKRDENFVCNPYQDVLVALLDSLILLHSASISTFYMNPLTPSNHEEADKRIFLHCHHASINGLKFLMISTVDSDVVVLAVHFFNKLDLTQLWIKFGVGEHKQYIAVHEIVLSLGPEICAGITFFHAWSGCDTTSAFEHYGKKSHWKTWMEFPRIRKTFQKLSTPAQLDADDCKELNIFQLKVYHHGRPEENLDEARKNLVFNQACPPEKLPPTSAALKQHALRSLLTAGHVWGPSTVKMQNLADPKSYGWTQDASGKWKVFWTPLMPAIKSIINKNCGCKNNVCRGN